MTGLTRWIKRLQICSGLLNFTILMISGVAGLAAAMSSAMRSAW